MAAVKVFQKNTKEPKRRISGIKTAPVRGKFPKRMLDIKKYKEDFDKLGIYDEQEQLEILNSLLQLAIITQNNYNNIYQDSDDKDNSTIQQVK